MFNRIKFIGFLLIAFCIAAPAKAVNSLDTQFGPNGINVHVVQAKIKDDVLTIALMYDGAGTEGTGTSSYPLREVNYVANNEKYLVLRDKNGEWLASPLSKRDKKQNDDDRIQGFYLKGNSKEIVWFKFPAPPEEVNSIELQIPNITPFTIDMKR